jgi:hypothetical protein
MELKSARFGFVEFQGLTREMLTFRRVTAALSPPFRRPFAALSPPFRRLFAGVRRLVAVAQTKPQVTLTPSKRQHRVHRGHRDHRDDDGPKIKRIA